MCGKVRDMLRADRRFLSSLQVAIIISKGKYYFLDSPDKCNDK
jgi:hypothetical protein